MRIVMCMNATQTTAAVDRLSDEALIAAVADPFHPAYVMVTVAERAHALVLLSQPGPQCLAERRVKHRVNLAVARTAKYLRACLLGGKVATLKRILAVAS